MTWVPGVPADRAEVTRPDQAAATLAGFLRALHRPAPANAPTSTYRGVPLRTLGGEFEEKFRAVAEALPAADEVRGVWKDAVAAPDWRGAALWLHGDLHPANVVVADCTLAGILDFGELCAGDPATDVAAAWLLLPSGATPSFLAACDHADADTIRRARGWAIRLALSLVAVGLAGERGLAGGQPTWKQAGLATLERVLAHV